MVLKDTKQTPCVFCFFFGGGGGGGGGLESPTTDTPNKSDLVVECQHWMTKAHVRDTLNSQAGLQDHP